MKKILLSFLIIVPILIQAREVVNLNDLRPNDTFSMKITIPTDTVEYNSVWNFEQGYKIDVDFKVLAINKDSIQVAIKPTRLLAWFQNPTDTHTSAFFDSNYTAYYDYKSWFYLFNDNSTIASINIEDGGVYIDYKDDANNINYAEEEESTGRSRREWYIQNINTPKGLKVSNYDSQAITDGYIYFDKVMNQSLNGFIKEWKEKTKKGLSMPWLVDIKCKKKQEADTPTFIQITSASFDLRPNTFVLFKAKNDIPEDRVFIKMGNERIKPTKKEGNNYSFNLYMSSPKRAYINELTLDLSPSDSLIVGYNFAIQDYEFSGKGAANSLFTNKMIQLYDGKILNLDKEVRNYKSFEKVINAFDSNLKDSEEFFKKSLIQHSDGMNDYWIKSAKLSFDYWYVNKRLKPFDTILQINDFELSKIRKSLKDDPNKLKELDRFYDEIQIPWDNQHFTNIFPFGDYIYQPYTYNGFVNNFFTYKAKEASNTVMTGVKYLLEHIGSYYFADAIFWGYPRSYLTSETLKYMMINFQLSENNREYENFLKNLHNPEIRNTVIELHDQLMKVEPGANIKELKLDIEKYIPIKNNDNYTILLVGDSLGFNQNINRYTQSIKSIYDSLHSEINKVNLAGKIDICIITSESSKTILDNSPEIQNKIIFVPDGILRDYDDKVMSRKRCYLILRSDGTIVNRSYDGSYSSSPFFVMKAIQEDIKTQKNKDSASSGVLIIIVTILISTLITFVLVRYIIMRRERIKRHIQELELKAIRAQMNPHFIFNALGSIQNLISQNKENEANKYLVDFAKLLRMVLSSSEKKLVSLSDEISMLHLYLHLEQLRVSFNYNILVDNNINTQIEEIPGMLIQPIVENAVKHGIMPKGEGEIVLNFSLQNGILYVVVTDNGNGFTVTTDKKTTGFGLKSVRERLTLLNKELHLDMSLKIENIEENKVVKGCKVTLMIPIL